MKSSTELIAYYNKRKQALEENADNPFTMFLEGYGEGLTDGIRYTIDKVCVFIYSELAEGNLTCNDDIEIILCRLKDAMNGE